MQSKLKILVLMPIWHVNFETRYFRLVKILRERGFSVDFCIFTQEMNKRREITFPGIPKERLSLPQFRSLDAKAINSFHELFLRLLKANIVVKGTGKGLIETGKVISLLNLPLMEIADIGDSYAFYHNADIFVISGEAFKENIVNINRDVPKERLVIAGDMRFDSACEVVSESQKEDFYKRYKLDSSRKFVVFCSGAFQRMDEWSKEIHKRIVEILKDNGFQVIVRLHPSDYAGYKRPKGVEVSSNILLYPELPAVESYDIDTAMKLCAFMAVNYTTTIIEASIYRKNAIAINYHESCLTEEGRRMSVFPEKRFNGCGLKTPFKGSNGEFLQSKYIRKDAGLYRTESFRFVEFSWVGADCHISELPEVLKSKQIFEVDDEACSRHIEKYWHKRDGLTSQRIALLIEQMAKDSKLQKRMFISGARKLLFTLKYLLYLFRKTSKKQIYAVKNRISMGSTKKGLCE
ncbi:MAG TPA: hypothetical protein VI976_04160 [Candidatus Omnitrophota bacterium]|nr:hypothetical protein [Candidatus Omnitrophota bacterium]